MTCNNTCMRFSTWSQANSVTSTWRECGFTPMTSSRSPASSSRLPSSWKTSAATSSGACWLSSGLQAVTSSSSRGPEKAERTWEPVSRVFHDAPAVLRNELKALRLKAGQTGALLQRYGLRLS